MADLVSNEYPEAMATYIEAIHQHPNDISARLNLVELCYDHVILHELSDDSAVFRLWMEQVAWIIEYAPDSKAAAGPRTSFHLLGNAPSEYQHCKHLWLKQVEKMPDNALVLYNAARFLTHFDLQTAQGLMWRANQLAPEDNEIAYNLSRIYSRLAESAAQDVERQEYEAKAFAFGNQSLAGSTKLMRYYHLGYVASLAVSTSQFEVAESYAQELLRLAQEIPRDWNYGNAIHYGNTVLGRLSLHRNELVAARQFLLASGQTPGSPQLDSFGPSMMLARDLVKLKEYTAVIEYLELCSVFWECGQDKLQNWIEELRQGKAPIF